MSEKQTPEMTKPAAVETAEKETEDNKEAAIPGAPGDASGTVPEASSSAEHKEKKSRKKKDELEYENINMPPVSGSVLRRALWREWRGSLLTFCFASAYIELCLHLCVYGSIDGRIVYPVLFALTGGLLCSLIASGLPKLPGRILALVLVSAQTVFAEVQLVYQAIFGNFMPISQTKMADGVVTNFGRQILYGIGQNIFPILLLLVPLIVMILTLVLRKAPRYRLRWKQELSTLGLLAAVLGLTFGLMYQGRGETFSVYEIFTNVNTSTDTSYRNVGMLATTEQELRYMLLGDEAEDTAVIRAGLDTTSKPRKYSSKTFNVIDDIDFQKLADSTDDELLKSLDEYMALKIPTQKNDYTGLLKGYNLITICAESYCPWFISKELTPTLYEMSHTGIIFENYYGTYQSVTTNGEYTMCMGLYPDMSRSKTMSSFDAAGSNYVPFCLGNALKAKGYQTWAYHNYIGDFYNRNITHPNMGYTFKAVDSGLNIHVDWPSSDLEMMEASVDDYLESSAPFHAYYMTFSGHYQYNWDNAMSAKNRDKVDESQYSEAVAAYIACNLELEYALEYLVQRLKEAGVLEKTCIVLTNDHYPYGLTEEEYNELAGKELDTAFEKYRNSFICYVPGLSENIKVDEYCSTADILPTLLNLFGVEYDSRLLMGTDVFSSGRHIAVLSDQSFLTESFRFDLATEEVVITDEKVKEVSTELLNQYRVYVQNKFSLSTNFLNTNYYAHVFGVENQGGNLEDTVVFTDIKSIFNQASVLYMYRNGFVDPVEPDTFGGRNVSEVGEFVDVMYRIARSAGTAESAAVEDMVLPEACDTDDFREDCPYQEAVAWAWQEGILREKDADDEWDDDVDFRTAAILIYRFAEFMGLDTTVDSLELRASVEEHPRMTEETIQAFLWVDDKNITTKTAELPELFENYSARISRYQMTSFLFYLCTYELHLEDE